MATGLDQKAVVGSPESTAVRSRIYRGLTRAQMMASVVQDHLVGGMLEFLCCLTLKDDHDILQHWSEH